MKVVVLSPHPDDDVIGCGGTIRKRIVEGAEVHSIYLSSGEDGGRPEGITAEEHSTVRNNEAFVASQVLGIKAVHFMHAPDKEVTESVPWLVENIAGLLRDKIGADINELYVTHRGEVHPDHSAAASIAQSLHVALPSIQRVLEYEVWTPLPTFDVVEDIVAEAGMKRAAIRCHKSQAQNAFDEAALALNHYRGLLHGPGILYAEVFQSW